MSVVNQMLRDLDRRQADPNNPVYAQHVGSAPARTNWLMIVLLCVIVAAGTAALMYFIQERSAPQSVTTAATPAPAPVGTVDSRPVVPPNLPQAPTPPIIETAPPPPVVLEAPTPPAPPVREAKPSAPPPNPQRERKTETPAKAEPAEAVTPPVAHNTRGDAAPVESAPPAAPKTKEKAPQTATTQAQPAGPAQIDMRPSALSAQTAEGEYLRAVALVNQARVVEARNALANALKMDARHEAARQTLAVLLIDAGLLDEAETVLSDGLRLAPSNANLAVVLARLKIERKDLAGALNVLKQHSGAATDNAQYRGFYAALLQRAGRHTEAIEEYRAAVRLVPAAGVWWMGLGLSYEANEQRSEALDAFSRARDTGSLAPDVGGFVERKIQALR